MVRLFANFVDCMESLRLIELILLIRLNTADRRRVWRLLSTLILLGRALRFLIRRRWRQDLLSVFLGLVRRVLLSEGTPRLLSILTIGGYLTERHRL